MQILLVPKSTSDLYLYADGQIKVLHMPLLSVSVSRADEWRHRVTATALIARNKTGNTP